MDILEKKTLMQMILNGYLYLSTLCQRNSYENLTSMGWLAWWDPEGCKVGKVFCPVGWTYWLTACWFWLVLCSFCWLCTIGGGGAVWNYNFNHIGFQAE